MRVYCMKLSDEGYACKGFIGEFEDTLDNMQRFVGGNIEVFALTPNLVLVCNEEGKLRELPLNRFDQLTQELFVGDLFCCRALDGIFLDIQPRDIEYINHRLLGMDLLTPVPNAYLPDFDGEILESYGDEEDEEDEY